MFWASRQKRWGDIFRFSHCGMRFQKHSFHSLNTLYPSGQNAETKILVDSLNSYPCGRALRRRGLPSSVQYDMSLTVVVWQLSQPGALIHL